MPQLDPSAAHVEYSGPSTPTSRPRYGPVITTWPAARLAHASWHPAEQASAEPGSKRASHEVDAIFAAAGSDPNRKFLTGKRPYAFITSTRYVVPTLRTRF